MTKTEELYGMPTDKLNSFIGAELVRAEKSIRISILKSNLSVVLEQSEGLLDPRVDKIHKAIQFWTGLRDEGN